MGILNIQGTGGNRRTTMLFDMTTYQAAVTIDPIKFNNLPPNALDVAFAQNGAFVEYSSVVWQKSVRIAERNPLTGAWVPIANAGTIQAQTGNRVLVTVQGGLKSGTYRITLSGTAPDAIVSQQGLRLDGEPGHLPSGNNVEGGDFDFELLVGAIG